MITTNDNFTDYGFPGDGTVSDPYTISGYNITTTDICISIKNTDAYFTIRDCFLYGVRNGVISYHCIRLDSAINGKIENNTISGSVTGVTIENSPGIIIANSTISNTTSGIDVSSPDVLIANNTITGNM
ncbi:MAG: NosD domain-containing protein, partial [Candidatus Thorarchaeota archaeon]